MAEGKQTKYYQCCQDTGYTEAVIVHGNIQEDIRCPPCGAVIISTQIDDC